MNKKENCFNKLICVIIDLWIKITNGDVYYYIYEKKLIVLFFVVPIKGKLCIYNSERER